MPKPSASSTDSQGGFTVAAEDAEEALLGGARVAFEIDPTFEQNLSRLLCSQRPTEPLSVVRHRAAVGRQLIGRYRALLAHFPHYGADLTAEQMIDSMRCIIRCSLRRRASSAGKMTVEGSVREFVGVRLVQKVRYCAILTYERPTKKWHQPCSGDPRLDSDVISACNLFKVASKRRIPAIASARVVSRDAAATYVAASRSKILEDRDIGTKNTPRPPAALTFTDIEAPLFTWSTNGAPYPPDARRTVIDPDYHVPSSSPVAGPPEARQRILPPDGLALVVPGHERAILPALRLAGIHAPVDAFWDALGDVSFEPAADELDFLADEALVHK